MARTLGAIKTADCAVDVTFSVDVGAHASGDLLAQPVKLADVAFTDTPQRITTLMSVTVIDPDDQGQNLTLLFHNAELPEIGARNAAPTISDAQAATCEGYVALTSYEDVGGAQVACEDGIGLTMQASADGHLWAWLLSKGTGTYAGGKLHVKMRFIRH